MQRDPRPCVRTPGVQGDPQTPWHEDSAFWTELQDGIFDPQAWEMADDEAAQLLRLTSLANGAAVLDIPCGPGRHVVPIARRGLRVCGVDLNLGYLQQARRRADEADVDVELIAADMREFVRPSSFDLVINLYTSFGYCSDPADDLRMLQNWRRSLRPGGQLVLELVTRETARAGEPRTYRLDATRSISEHATLSTDRSVMERCWTVQASGVRRSWIAHHRLYDVPTLRALLQSAGFHAVQSHGGLDGRELSLSDDCAVLLARLGP